MGQYHSDCFLSVFLKEGSELDFLRESVEGLFQGLDKMVEKSADARNTIAESLQLLRQVKREQPNLVLLQVIISAKSEELVQMFSDESFPDERNRVVQILKEIDPANASNYQKILTNK